MPRGRNTYLSVFVSTVQSLVAGIFCVLATGCADMTVRPNPALVPKENPPIYNDRDWSAVLSDNVRDGLVDYEKLAAHREALDRFYALISVVGPTRAPDQFNTRTTKTAYWINTYNALVLLAVLQKYPCATVHDLSMPQLEYDYRFLVDGKSRNLWEVEGEMLADSTGDVRALFATSRGALGTPRLMSEPLRPESLESQLTQAAMDSLDNPDICAVDHVGRSILVWQTVLRRESEFVAYWQVRRRVKTAYLYNVLMDMASPSRQQTFQSAVGYQIRAMPFNRKLNKWPPDASSTGGR